METTNSTTANNALTSMMDAYKKHLSQVSDFYTNTFNSFSAQSKNMWLPQQTQSSLFFNYDALQAMFSPFNNLLMKNSVSNPFTNLFANPFDKLAKNVSDYNHNLIGSLSKQLDHSSTDANSMNDTYQKLVEERTQASKHYIQELAETFNKQMESSLVTHKKLQDETHKQFEDILKMNQRFWTSVLNNNQSHQSVTPFSKDVASELKKDKATAKS